MKLCALLLALLPAALAADASLLGISSPLLVWSNRELPGQGAGQHVSYQVLQNAELVATDVVLSAVGKPTNSRLHGLAAASMAEGESRTVVLFVGSQLDTLVMRTRSESVRSLDTLLTTAASSLAVPYTVSKGESIRETVCKKMDAEGVQHEVVGCKAPSADLAADVKAALAKGSASAPNVVIVCSNVAPEQEGTAAGLAAEVEQLQTVQAAVASAGDHVVVYASQPKPEAAQAGGARRRSLVTSFTGFGAYTSCGTLCQTQVRWLEGMVAMLVLALASCAGLVCLYVLDTPTRFETPKDAAPAQS